MTIFEKNLLNYFIFTGKIVDRGWPRTNRPKISTVVVNIGTYFLFF